MGRRVGFFLIAALVCLAVAPVTQAEIRWVPEVLSGTYGVLALLALLDGLGRRRL
jgi:hypothetical protein